MGKIIILLFLFFLPFLSFATSGCCSHHGGVCGCDSSVGKQSCCDGTLSPSCTCAYNPPPQKYYLTSPFVASSLEADISKEWCGAGKMFYSKNDADKSLEEYKNTIKKPLQDKISNLDAEKDNLESKTWINFILLISLYIICIISIFTVFSCEKCNNNAILDLIISVLVLFFLYLILGGFNYLHP
jgi:hypothetical protein